MTDTNQKMQIQNHRERPSSDDEIDLVDLWMVIWNRKLVLMIVSAIIIMAGVFYLSLAKPTYESNVMIEIGKLDGGGFADDPDRLIFNLFRQFGDPDDPEEAHLASAEIMTGNVLKIIVQGEKPQDVYETSQQIADQVINDHKVRFDQLLKPSRQRLEHVQLKIDAIEEVMTQVNTNELELSDSMRTFVVLERSRLVSELDRLQREAMDLTLKLNSVDTYPSSIISFPEYPEYPAGTQKKLVLAISVVLGLMGGVFSTFLAEFIHNARQRMKSEFSHRRHGD